MSDETKGAKSSKSFWVCWRPKDALDGMSQLTTAEELAYRRILDMIFATDDKLHDDDQTLAWSTRAGRQWKAVKSGLITKGKIACVGGFIRNQRATDTCIETRTFRAQRSAAAVASHQSPKRLKNKEARAAAAHASASAGAGTNAEPSAHASHQLPREELRSSTEGRLFPEDDPPRASKGRPKRKPADPAAKPTPNGLLHGEGAEKLGRMTGEPPETTNKLLGAWKRDYEPDPAKVLGAVRRTFDLWVKDETGSFNAKGAIVNALKPPEARATPKPPQPLPELAGGKVVRTVIAKCEDITGVSWSGLDGFQDFDLIIVDALKAGADPDRHIFPVMSGAERMGWQKVEGLGFFRKGIWGLMQRERERMGVAA